MTATMPNVSRDLYPDLGPEQRAYLNREWRPSRQEAAELGPYPLLPETAAAVEYLQRNYVLPWPMVRERHLAPWVRDYFIARGARDIPLITPVDMTDKLKVFRRVGETRAYWAGTDYQNGLAGVPDAQYEEVFSHLQATVAALALEEPIKAGATVYMPTFPFGPASMRVPPHHQESDGSTWNSWSCARPVQCWSTRACCDCLRPTRIPWPGIAFSARTRIGPPRNQRGQQSRRTSPSRCFRHVPTCPGARKKYKPSAVALTSASSTTSSVGAAASGVPWRLPASKD